MSASSKKAHDARELSALRPLVAIAGFLFFGFATLVTYVGIFVAGALATPDVPAPPSNDIPGVVGWGALGGVGYFLLGAAGTLRYRGSPVIPASAYWFTLGSYLLIFLFLTPFLFSGFTGPTAWFWNLDGKIALFYSIPATMFVALISLRARQPGTWTNKVVRRRWWMAGLISVVPSALAVSSIGVLLLEKS